MSRQEIRDAMKWWRASHPDDAPYVRVVHHGYYGHVVWTVRNEARPLATVTEVINEFRAAHPRTGGAE